LLMMIRMGRTVRRRLALGLYVAGLMVLGLGALIGATYGTLRSVPDLAPTSDTSLCPRYPSILSNPCLVVDRSRFSPPIPPWPYIGGKGPCGYTGCVISVPAGAPQISAQAAGCTAMVVQVGDTTYQDPEYPVLHAATIASPFLAGLMIVVGFLLYPARGRALRPSSRAATAATVAIIWVLGCYTLATLVGSESVPLGLLLVVPVWLAASSLAAAFTFASDRKSASPPTSFPQDRRRAFMATGAAFAFPLIGVAGLLAGNGAAGC
jgi:hypothetical protein